MNRLSYILLWLGAALLASCSADMEPDAQPSELQAIQLTAETLSAMEQTRAASSDNLQNTAFAGGVDVAVYLVDQASSSTYATRPYRFRAAAAVGGQNLLIYFSDDTHASTLYYPVTASASVNIYGFYPYSRFSVIDNHSTTNLSVAVNPNQSTITGYRNSDVMMATPITNQARTSSAVGLTFRHLMAKLVIRLKQGVHSGTTSIVNNSYLNEASLTIGNVITHATLDMTTGTVTTGSNSVDVIVATNADLAFYYDNSGTAIGTTEYAIVLPPQALTGKTITINPFANGTITGTLPELTLTAGSSTILTLTVNDSGIEATRTNYSSGGSTTWN